MAEKERDGILSCKSLKIGSVAMPRLVTGTLSVTGTGSVVAPGMTSVSSAVATLVTDPSLTGDRVSCAITGTTVTLKVWKPTASGDTTPIAATLAKTVAYVIAGS